MASGAERTAALVGRRRADPRLRHAMVCQRVQRLPPGRRGPVPLDSAPSPMSPPAPAIAPTRPPRCRTSRRRFTCARRSRVSASDAARADPLSFDVRFNDGFVCYLNGVEVARRNAGPANSLSTATNRGLRHPGHHRAEHHSLPPHRDDFRSARPTPASSPAPISWPSTRSITGRPPLSITPPPTYHRGDHQLRQLLFQRRPENRRRGARHPGVQRSTWRYLPGLVEPSGGVYDPTLIVPGETQRALGPREFRRFALDQRRDSLRGAGTPPSGVTLGTNLTSQIPGLSTSLYTRIVFTATAADLADPKALQLLVDWDDGFVAYLNGVEVVARPDGGRQLVHPA